MATEEEDDDDAACLLLSGFQGDDDEDRASVHPANTARVTHEVVQDCGEFCPNLREKKQGNGEKQIKRQRRGWKKRWKLYFLAQLYSVTAADHCFKSSTAN